MNKQIPIYFLIIWSLIGCNSDHKKKLVAAKKNIHAKFTYMPDTNKVLMSGVCVHSFSDDLKKDTFKLLLTGKSLLEGHITFEIVNAKKEKIYNEKFDAYDLLGDIDDTSPSGKQKLDTFKTRFANFFKSKAFSVPALDRKQPIDPDYIDINIQKDIRADSTAIGFVYSYGYEGVYEIAWSKKNKKVVVCFASD